MCSTRVLDVCRVASQTYAELGPKSLKALFDGVINLCLAKSTVTHLNALDVTACDNLLK